MQSYHKNIQVRRGFIIISDLHILYYINFFFYKYQKDVEHQ